MTEFSMLWETQTGSGDGANSYTEEQATFFFKDFTTAEQASMGVLSGIDNELEVTGSTSPLAVNTGKGVCYGFRYENDASKNVTVTTPAVGDTGGRVVLRASWGPTNTVRAVVVLNTDGNPAIPALTQSALTTWDVPLATFVIDTTGNIWTDASKTVAGVTDARSFALTPLAGMIKLREFTGNGSTGVCTFNNIQQDLSSLLLIGQALSDRAALTDDLSLTLNNDAGANYKWLHYEIQNGVFTHNNGTAGANIDLGQITGSGGGALASAGDAIQILIPNYNLSTLIKSVFGDVQTVQTGVATDLALWVSRGWWNNTSAITRLDLSVALGNFETGTKITLYGMR